MVRKEEASVADLLRTAVKESGLTSYRIAKDAGIAQIVLDRFVHGERDLRLETAAKVARVLGLTLKPM